MNIRLVILFSLLMCGVSHASAHSQRAILQPNKKILFIESPTNLPADSRSTAGDTFISATHDVVSNAAAVPMIGAFLILIGIIGNFDRHDLLSPSRPPGRTILFKVLFRSIISPNAP